MAALFAASAVFLSCSCSGGESDSGPVIGGETGGGVNTGIMNEILAGLLRELLSLAGSPLPAKMFSFHRFLPTAS